MTKLSKVRTEALRWASQGRVYDSAKPQGITYTALLWARDEGYIVAYKEDEETVYELTEEGRDLLEGQDDE